MPTRPQKPCCSPNCPNLTTSRYCEQHTAEQPVRKAYDRWRGSASSRGYDAAWERVRKQALIRDAYLCQRCLEEGRANPALDVDHILPISQRPELRLEINNLMSLCRPHHVTKTATEKT